MVILILVAIIIAGMSNQLHNTDDNAENLFNAVHKLEDEVDKLDKN